MLLKTRSQPGRGYRFPECGDKKKQIQDRFYPVAYTRNGKPFYVKPTIVYFRFSLSFSLPLSLTLSPFPDEKTERATECANIGWGRANRHRDAFNKPSINLEEIRRKTRITAFHRLPTKSRSSLITYIRTEYIFRLIAGLKDVASPFVCRRSTRIGYETVNGCPSPLIQTSIDRAVGCKQVATC